MEAYKKYQEAFGSLGSDDGRLKKLKEACLFWAAMAGNSPKVVHLWQGKVLWKSPEQADLLRMDFASPKNRSKITSVALAHRKHGQHLFAAALFLWLGDAEAACYDCLLRGLRDWQLGLLAASLHASAFVRRKCIAFTLQAFALPQRDPWMTIGLLRLAGYSERTEVKRLILSQCEYGMLELKEQLADEWGDVAMDSLPDFGVDTLHFSKDVPAFAEVALIMATFGEVSL